MTLYFTSTDKSVRALLAQKVEFLFCRKPLPHANFYYTIASTLIYGLPFQSYQSFKLFEVFVEPRHVWSDSAMLLQLSKFDIAIVAPKGLLSQPLLDYTQFSSNKDEPLSDEFDGEKCDLVSLG